MVSFLISDITYRGFGDVQITTGGRVAEIWYMRLRRCAAVDSHLRRAPLRQCL